MNIICNGSPVELPVGSSVQILIETLSLEPRGLAVAVDDSLVTKSLWATCILQEGARVTVIRAAQGG